MVGLLLVAVVFALAWRELVLAGALACLGDDGVPFAAPDSPRGQLCRARSGPVVGPLSALLVAVAPAVLVGGGAVAVVRRRARVLVVSAAVAFATLGLVTLPYLLLPAG